MNSKTREMIAGFLFFEAFRQLYVQAQSLGGRVKPDHGEI
jgi:hypothetical protein